MTDELTPSLVGRKADTDAEKTERLTRAAAAVGEALKELIDGKVILAVDGMIIVQHPDDKVGCSSFNIGVDDQVKGWAAQQSLRHHSGRLGTPDKSESYRVQRPKKH